jgi:hypothetical protein
MSVLRDTRIAGYAVLIERVRRRTTVYRRVTTPQRSVALEIQLTRNRPFARLL